MAGELLASVAEINGFLSSSLYVKDAVDDQMQIDAVNVIKSQLTGVFQPATIATWVSPTTTPLTIRMIAARLIAARWYVKQIAGEANDNKIPAYAQQLYNEAIGMLASIKMGSISVIGDDGGVISDPDSMELGEGDYYPNIAANTSPLFTVGKKWG